MKPLLDSFTSMAIMPMLVYQAAAAQAVQYCQEQLGALATLCESVAGQPVFGQATLTRRPKDHDLFVGKSLSKSKTISDLHTLLFGLLSLDFNPLHFNEDLSRRTRFGGRIAHGFHTASLFTGVLSELTPWCVFLHQEMDFTAPVRPGELVTATGVIEEIDPSGVVHVALACRNAQGETVVRGRALVKKLKEAYQRVPAP
jgi:3-hydroxybutyryl-CoA dehydratase